MKIVENIVAILFLLLIIGIGFVVFHERYYTSKFKRTEIPISFSEFKEIWGEPDKVMKYKEGDKTVFYHAILNEFVFNVDERGLVQLKYQD